MSDNETGPTIDRAFAEAFAREWIEAWNTHDLERVLSHYAEEAEMASPFIRRVVGEPSGVLHGKDALRAYWGAALERMPDLHFTLRQVFVSAHSVAIYYDAVGGLQAVEYLEFGPDGRVIRAAAHYDNF